MHLRKKFKFLFLGIILLLSIWTVFNLELLSYAFSQGKGQLKIVFGARKINEVLADPNVPDTLKQKLGLVAEIKRFAIDSLWLKKSDSYESFFDQQGKPILWIVTASEKYELKPYEWTFPFLGKVPYKGFFKEADANEEAAKFNAKGFDTGLGTTSGWSTLGWLPDPVLSGMLNRSEGSLASLIIHEMVHGTFYIKDNAKLNENLASFIGDEGAKLFLANKYGAGSPEYADYLNEQSDEQLFNRHVIAGAERLRILYEKIQTKNEDEKDSLKNQLINAVIIESELLPFALEQNKSRIKRRKKIPNNTFFMDYLRYDSMQEELKKELLKKFNNDLRLQVQHYENNLY